MNEWKWHRKKKKSTLVLFSDGKKLGYVSLRENAAPPDEDDEYQWNDLYVAYKGGGRIGVFATAKIAVETALGVSTKKSKKKPEPERVKKS